MGFVREQEKAENALTSGRTDDKIYARPKQEVMVLSPRTGRPPKGKQSRTEKITIRLSSLEVQKVQECADRLNTSRTDALVAGIDLLKTELDQKAATQSGRSEDS